jgi:hypothetical protein
LKFVLAIPRGEGHLKCCRNLEKPMPALP